MRIPKELLREVQEWRKQVFKDETTDGIIGHFIEEVQELQTANRELQHTLESNWVDAFGQDDPSLREAAIVSALAHVREELADCLHMNIATAMALGIDMETLVGDYAAKFRVNTRLRTWKDGRHVR